MTQTSKINRFAFFRLLMPMEDLEYEFRGGGIDPTMNDATGPTWTWPSRMLGSALLRDCGAVHRYKRVLFLHYL